MIFMVFVPKNLFHPHILYISPGLYFFLQNMCLSPQPPVQKCRNKEKKKAQYFYITGTWFIIFLDKRGIQINIFLFLQENICYGYSLEVPQWGTSNEYPQHMFFWKSKEKNSNTICWKKESTLSGGIFIVLVEHRLCVNQRWCSLGLG